MAPADARSEILTTWKEIAEFFGKGVRTVQRWEEFGLPVHRPSTDKTIVFAHTEELRRWALRRRALITSPQQERCRQLIADSKAIVESTRRLIAEAERLMHDRKQGAAAD